MILHIPSAEVMTRKNVIESDDAGQFLTSVIEASKPQTRTRGLKGGVLMAGAASAPDVEVFETGIYTVVLSQKPSLILQALRDRVPERRRPKVSVSLMRWYQQHFPGWSFALCCFDNSVVRKSKPLVWWYKPKYPQFLFAPGVDAHDGNPPDLDAKVACDHEVAFGSMVEDLPRSDRYRPRIRLDPRNHGKLGSLLPKHGTYKGYTSYGKGGFRNADFVMDLEGFYHGAPKIQRGLITKEGQLG
jgi:hypothetical protein